MSAMRVTVSITDGLAKRAEKWKDRYSPSELYQKALEDFVSKKERLVERMKGEPEALERIVERLKMQKEATELDYFRNGESDGLAWAQKADYPEFKHAISISPYELEPHGEYNVEPLFSDRFLSSYFLDRIHENDSWDVYVAGVKRGKTMLSIQGKAYLDGWFEAVRAFWEEVAPKIGN